MAFDARIRSRHVRAGRHDGHGGVISTALGFGAAYTDYRYKFFGKQVYLALALLPPTIPVIILGLAMLAYLSRINLSGNALSVIISHVVVCAPFAMAIIRLRLSQMDPALEPAAWNLGASEWKAMTSMLHQVHPGIHHPDVHRSMTRVATVPEGHGEEEEENAVDDDCPGDPSCLVLLPTIPPTDVPTTQPTEVPTTSPTAPTTQPTDVPTTMPTAPHTTPQTKVSS